MQLHLGLFAFGIFASIFASAGEPNFSVFQSQVREIPRRVLVYHFRERTVDDHLPQSGYIDTLDPILGPVIRDRLARDMAAFLDIDADFNGSQLGPGVYAANNPLASWSFGGDNFSMYVIPLRKGAKYFDVRKASMSKLSSAQQALLKSFGCDKDTLGGLVRSSSGGCRSAVIGIAKALGVSVLIYDWDKERTIPECTTMTTAAFSLIQGIGVDWERFRYLTRESTPVGYPETAKEDRMSVNVYLTRNWYSQAWKVEDQPVDAPGSVPSVNLTEWFQENLYTCGGKPEDLPWR